LSLDGNFVTNADNGFEGVTGAAVLVTAGSHQVSVTDTNYGGPAGVAAQILKPDNSELWNTRYPVSPVHAGTNGEDKEGDGGGGGGGGGGLVGGPGGYVNGGDDGAYSGNNGTNLVPAGWTVGSGSNGGAPNSYAGGSGTVLFTW
jgi:hypothetical protein